AIRKGSFGRAREERRPHGFPADHHRATTRPRHPGRAGPVRPGDGVGRAHRPLRHPRHGRAPGQHRHGLRGARRLPRAGAGQRATRPLLRRSEQVGIVLAMLWGVFGMFVGDWVAWLLAYPDLNFDAAWSSFGRLRPAHTTGIIFGFAGNALIATSFHVMQRTSRARLPDQLSPWFVLLGYNLFCVLAVTGYFLGITQSKEYAEPEWYADIWLVIVWVAYFGMYLRTLARRKEPHIYVANWYYMAFILVVAVLHIVNNLAVPISFGSAKSYSLFSGGQDAMTQWWYGHNAVA